MNAMKTLEELKPSATSTVEISGLQEKCFEALSDDLNSPIAIAHLFDGVKMINAIKAGKEQISAADLHNLQDFYRTMVFDILGLREEVSGNEDNNEILDKVMNLLIDLRQEAKNAKNWDTADKIRNALNASGITLKDTKEGAEWSLE